MSNPAPTLNQINAFNATQGTTIDFNIIGGTEVIRSNKIYIYDLSDNSLICTHLYVSTESIHELPANTDSSIVYASGKSSADFTNNTQYYVQIQTFTDVGGTQGGSGLSIAKLFWCLPTPTLTLSTIPTTISTTSYNVSATYTPNTSGSATNEIQEFQFNLYSAIGALLQTSGVVLYGEGVDLSYNFSGLEVDSTYYVTLDVTTTQGMNVSAQSNTFTVSIDTPTMGSASVVNNGCDGYISVTSNLSSEYEHEESSEAGEIMSFTTDSVNDITELDVDFSPIQDGTPWMSAQDTEPYMFRAVPTQTEDFGHEVDTLVGGTVVWNQLIEHGNFDATTGWSTAGYGNMTVNNNIGTVTLTDAGTSGRIERSISPKVGHKVLCVANIKPSFSTNLYITFAGTGAGAYFARVIGATADSWNQISGIRNVVDGDLSSGVIRFYFGGVSGSVGATVQFKDIVLFDLTAMFGSTIADYVYTLEQSQAGSGIAWLKSYGFFTEPYYAYDSGSLVSVSGLQSHEMVGVNAFDKSAITTGKWLKNDYSGDVETVSGYNVSDYIRVCPNTEYYKSATGSARSLYYDANKNAIGGAWAVGQQATTFTTPQNAQYIRLTVTDEYVNTAIINLSDASINGTYYPHTKHTYPLDDSITLRGVLKLVDGKLVYDGDEYHSNGGVDRKYAVVDMGTLNWSNSNGIMNVSLSDVLRPSTWNIVSDAMCAKYQTVSGNTVAGKTVDKTLGVTPTGFVYVYDSAYASETGATFKTAMSGVQLQYPLATPTTETADPYTNPQIVDPHGTEQYVGSPIPVGHKTTYQRICPISGWDSVEVDVVGKNLLDPSLLKEQAAWNTFGLSVKPSTQYTASSDIDDTSGLLLYFRDTNGGGGSAQQKVYSTHPVTLTSTADGKLWVSQRVSSGTDTFASHKIQIEEGSTATPYTPYNGTTYTTTFPKYKQQVSQDKIPYITKNIGDTYADTLTENLVGGTIAWNQSVPDTTTTHTVSGSIASMDDAVAGNFESVVCDIEPIQNGTPWMSTPNTEPYTFRAVPTQTEDFGHESDIVVGGTVAWNQQAYNGDFALSGYWTGRKGTLSISDGVATVTATEATTQIGITQTTKVNNFGINHKYLFIADALTPIDCTVWFSISGGSSSGSASSRVQVSANTWKNIGAMWTYSSNISSPYVYVLIDQALAVGDVLKFKNVMCFDLTQMFGSTIANYVYSLETANAGAGVAWFRKLFPNAYYPYDAGSLVSVSGLTSHDMVGFNQLDPTSYIIDGASNYNKAVGSQLVGDGSSATVSGTNPITVGITAGWRGATFISEPLVYGNNYQLTCTISAPTIGDKRVSLIQIDEDDTILSCYNFSGNSSDNLARTVVPNAQGARVALVVESTTAQVVTVNNLCLHLSWDGERDGTYEPYVKHSYPLDSDLTLRGIPKLDSNNNLYYDGDEYRSDGGVTRKYGIVDLGTLSWTYYSSETAFYCSISGLDRSGGYVICDGYTRNWTSVSNINNLEFTGASGADGVLWFKNTAYTDATSFKASVSGKYLVYKLKTPTTETADPFTNPQEVDPYGTEEYVGSPIPVGHMTTYQRICPITGWTGCEVSVGRANGIANDYNDASNGYVSAHYLASDGTETSMGGYAITEYIPTNAGDVCYIDCSGVSAPSVCFYDENHNFVYGEKYNGRTGVTVTAPNNSAFVRFSFATAYRWQIKVTNTTYPVSWQTEAGTVYGGYLTIAIVDGEPKTWIVGTHKSQILNGSEAWNSQSQGSGIMPYLGMSSYGMKQNQIGLSDMFPNAPSTNPADGHGLKFGSTAYNVLYVVGILADLGLTTLAEWQTWLSTNNTQIVYELATPQIYQLDPVQVACLLGQNNVWNNISDTTVTYPTNHSYQSLSTTHKYYKRINGVESISVGSDVVVDVGTDNIIDLTQMFGTTIADYIYNTEQSSSSGMGVKFLKSLFPNDDYDYNSGELISVNASAHVIKDANGNVVNTYPLDSDLVLRGIPKLDANNKLYYDGDVYEADGSVTRKYIHIPKGSTFNYVNTSSSGYKTYSFNMGGASNKGKAGTFPLYNLELKNVQSFSSATVNEECTQPITQNNNYIYFAISGSRDIADVEFIYELATHTTETADPFEENQTIVPNGIEEYTVTEQGDVEMPVGHDSTYYATEVYGGTIDMAKGVLMINCVVCNMGTLTWTYNSTYNAFFASISTTSWFSGINLWSSSYDFLGTVSDSAMSTAVNGTFGCGSYNGLQLKVKNTTYTNANDFKSAMNGVQLVYELATPIEISLTPQQMQTLSGQNNIWSNTNGGMYLVYQLPITSLLVKRRDVADVSGKWLTLYSTPITQASDMDFTFIDFLNQYGKTYQYALVPVLAQDQSGVVVQIEGGYTVSDNVDSIFDGVYIADQTNVERVKAGVGYGNIDMNQGVGSITPIGSKYPIVITNSQNQYHNGSVRGTIVPNDFYSNGNLSRIDMVNKRDELEQFLTNKRAKIIKDWNGKMWLVMIMSNVACSFDDNYGMGMVSFSADWLEVGDPTNQQDLYNAGLINVGGV